MNDDVHECFKAATRLLDPRFNYIPSVATNIAATWTRFGFDPQANQQRRERLKDSLPAATLTLRGRLKSY